MLWLAILCIILLAAVIVLAVKLVLMRKAATEICRGFSDRLKDDTNTLISISSHDSCICRLADSINYELRELRKARRRFQQGDLELKNTIANISHDLRTPLTAICGYLELLDSTENDETTMRYIEVIKNRTEMLKQLTEELFLYSIITSPEYDSPSGPVVLNSVLEESVAAFYTVLCGRGIKPDIRMPDKKVIREINRAALSRVFANLLSNAVKYSDGDLKITLTEKGEIVFSNTASELSKVQVGKLFDRFYTVETARRSTGLGLSIAKLLIEQMNGSIHAQYTNQKLSICISFQNGNTQKGNGI